MRRLLTIALAVSAAPSFALPIFSSRADTQDFESLMSAAYDFEGIVQLSNCSGSLVRFEHATDSDKGLVLTNGHCVPVNGDLMGPGKFLSNVPVQRQFSLLSKDGQTRIGTVASTRIVYATMTGTDAALYELSESYQQISDRYHVAPLAITTTHPTAGSAIEILSGYWHRGYGCQLDGFVFEPPK